MREVNQKGLSRILGLTTRQIRNLETEGLPHRSEGREKIYPLPEAVQWWRDREVRLAVGETPLTEARARKIEAEAGLREHELARKRGDFIARTDVGILLRRSLERVARGLDHAPARHAEALAKAAGIAKGNARRILGDMMELVRADLRNASGSSGKSAP